MARRGAQPHGPPRFDWVSGETPAPPRGCSILAPGTDVGLSLELPPLTTITLAHAEYACTLPAAMLNDREVEALAVAVLAVGGWPADRVRDALPRFRDVGLLAPADVARMDLGELTVKLAKNGYGRGLLTSMYAERLQAVMKEIAAGTLDGLPEMARAGEKGRFSAVLREIHGVGPKVAANAWELMLALVS